MAPKRSTHQDHPPPSVSSDEEERDEDLIDAQDVDDEEEQETKHKNAESEEVEEEESGEEDEEEEEEETPPRNPPTVEKKKPSVQNPTQSSSGGGGGGGEEEEEDDDEDEEGSDADSGSEEAKHSPTASDFTIKPIASKPMEPNKKPIASKAPAPASKPPAASKRPAAEQNGKDSRRKKAKVSNADDDDDTPVEGKKSSANRLWSEEDEVAVLKGMIDYQSKKGADPYADMAAFHLFVKGSLHTHVDVSKSQLTDKIRRLKKKYQINAAKGEDPVLSKPHENKTFELSKKIWGSRATTSNGVDDNVKGNNSKARMSTKDKTLVVAHMKEEVKPKEIVVQEDSKKEVVKADDEGDFSSVYPQLNAALEFEKVSNLALPEGARNLVREGMGLIGSAKAKELDEKWKDFRVDELKLYLRRLELIQEQTKLVLDAMKSSKS